MLKVLKENVFEKIFKISVIWRIFYGICKFITGIILLKIVPSEILKLFYSAGSKELVEDPNDFLINFIGHYIEKISSDTLIFIAVYLIFWGLADAILSYFLYKKVLWSYPVSLSLIGIFTVYEVLRFISTYSSMILFFIIIDLIIFFIIYREFGKIKRQIKN